MPRLAEGLVRKRQDLGPAVSAPAPALGPEEASGGAVDLGVEERIARPEVSFDQLLILLGVFPRDDQVVVRSDKPKRIKVVSALHIYK